MWDERNTGTNLPAQIDLYATAGGAYKFLFMAKGGGSANKSYLYPGDQGGAEPERMAAFLEDKLRSLGTAACPPYHLAIVVGGTSAEYALKTAKLASAKYLDALPTRAHRSRTASATWSLSRPSSRSPGGPASAPSSAASTSATTCASSGCPARRVLPGRDRGLLLGRPQALGKITSEGIFLEQLETDPAKYLPEAQDERTGQRRGQDRPGPPDERDQGRALPVPDQDQAVAERPLVVARDIAHAKIEERLAAGGPCRLPQRPRRVLRRAGEDAARATPPDRSDRRPPAAWTATWISSRPPAARW